jgi:hypothetical protein
LSIQIIVSCDAGTQIESNLTCEVSTQTTNDNEQLDSKTEAGAAENKKKK